MIELLASVTIITISLTIAIGTLMLIAGIAVAEIWGVR